jgi:hypothetical protein
MNPLFLGLLAAGAILVIGVLVYNLIQERRLRGRRRGTARPASEAADHARDAGLGRAEPMLNRGGDADDGNAVPYAPMNDAEAAPRTVPREEVGEAPARRLAARSSRDAIAPDADIECVVWLTPAQPAPTVGLAHGLAARAAKPTRWLGRSGANPSWRAIDGSTPGPWQEIAACMLLADRKGAATREELDAFLRLVEAVATSISAECVWPDEREEAGRAEALDRLCADLDVQIGFTILKPESAPIAGTRLRGVAEASGFRLSPAGQFEYVHEETGAVLYSLQNVQSEPFTLDGLRSQGVQGVVLLLDVPRVADPVKAYDQMRLLARRLAQTLEGVLVDDNRRPLDDAALGAIRAQVQGTVVALREAQIEPGGQRALRLFG